MPPDSLPQPRRAVAAWLFICCALVFAMVVVGGVTRLTHSGLSIVEWQPLVGAIPPLDAADWEALFAKYRLTPEFRLSNHDMTLEGFRAIFWWEYSHRLLGRVVGVISLTHRGAHATGLLLIAPLFAFAAPRAVFGAAAIVVPLVGLGGLAAASSLSRRAT